MTQMTPVLVPAPAKARRPGILLAAARPTGRALGLTPGPAFAALGAFPVAWTLARGGTDLTVAVIASALIGSSALAGAVEDAAATTTAAAPTTRLQIRTLRMAMLAGAAALTWVACLIGAALADVSIGEPDRFIAVCLATAGIAVAAASWMAGDIERGAGAAGSLTAIMIVLTSTAMNQQLPVFPTLMDLNGQDHRWLAVAAVAWVTTAWLNRDPAARTRRAKP